MQIRTINKIIISVILYGAMVTLAFGQTRFKPEDTEFYEPRPPVVHLTKNQVPTDALILFDGKDLDQWCSVQHQEQPAAWRVSEGILTVQPKTGDIRTKQEFEDFQLHLEWKSPDEIKGTGQGRGNSGIFLQGVYEIQILDNQDNPTYVNGQAGSLYKQRPPLVEVRSPSEGWHSYDIIYRSPRFNKDGMLVSKGMVTVLHNGVLIQNNTLIEGTTEYVGMPVMKAHGAGPIVLQDHGDLVQFRNIWIRSL